MSIPPQTKNKAVSMKETPLVKRLPHIRILGSGTCQLQPHRAAASVLVDDGSTRFVFDMGRGVTGRLSELGLRQDDIDHIVLSHLHPDHVSDVIPFLHAAAWSQIDPRSNDLHIYGPIGTKAFMKGVLDAFAPEDLQKNTFRIHVHDITGSSFHAGSLQIQSVPLPHANNRGIRITLGERTYACTGDAPLADETIAFLRGADVAVIDAGHPSDTELVELVVRANVPYVVLSHLYREINVEQLTEATKRSGYTGVLVAAHDLLSVDT